MTRYNVKRKEGNKMNVILRPILRIIDNNDTRFDEDDRIYWPYKVVQINKIGVKNTHREIFINKDFDLIGFSKKGSKWINQYEKENADGSVEICNKGFKYLIFQKELKNSIAVLPPKINDIGMNMSIRKEVIVKPSIGKVYITKNGAIVKIVASEPEGPFAKELTFVGLIRRPGIVGGGTPYQCDENGKAISHGGNEYYHLVEEQKSYTIYTYSWLNPDEKENSPVIHVDVNSDVLPWYLRQNPEVKYNLSISVSEF